MHLKNQSGSKTLVVPNFLSKAFSYNSGIFGIVIHTVLTFHFLYHFIAGIRPDRRGKDKSIVFKTKENEC
jgi:hypothetical protein